MLYAEQALGDTIQFIRYAALVKQRGGTVLVECQAALTLLLDGCPGIDRLVPSGSPLPAFEVQAALLSLPGLVVLGNIGELVLGFPVLELGQAGGIRLRNRRGRSRGGRGLRNWTVTVTVPTRWKRGGYSYATASERDAFPTITMDFGSGCINIHGYLLRDG